MRQRRQQLLKGVVWMLHFEKLVVSSSLLEVVSAEVEARPEEEDVDDEADAETDESRLGALVVEQQGTEDREEVEFDTEDM